MKVLAQIKMPIGSRVCVVCDKKTNQVILSKPSDPSEVQKAFTYDAVYDWNSS